jgi:hypothetical protein
MPEAETRHSKSLISRDLTEQGKFETIKIELTIFCDANSR